MFLGSGRTEGPPAAKARADHGAAAARPRAAAAAEGGGGAEAARGGGAAAAGGGEEEGRAEPVAEAGPRAGRKS